VGIATTAMNQRVFNSHTQELLNVVESLLICITSNLQWIQSTSPVQLPVRQQWAVNQLLFIAWFTAQIATGG